MHEKNCTDHSSQKYRVVQVPCFLIKRYKPFILTSRIKLGVEISPTQHRLWFGHQLVSQSGSNVNIPKSS